MFNRVIVIILEGLGIGASNTANMYGDEGANTALHVLDNNELPYDSLKQLGLYNLIGKGNDRTIAYFAKGNIKRYGKSTVAEHYEMMGINTFSPVNIFTEGLPATLITRLEEELKRKIIGNKIGATTDIINEFGDRHVNYGDLIISTSKESTIQVIAHLGIIRLEQLYEIAKKIKDITNEKEEWRIEKVLAVQFEGKSGTYQQTANHKDFTSIPPSKSILNDLKRNSFKTVAIGKVGDIFSNSGFTSSFPTVNNLEGMSKIVEAIKSEFSGVCLANLDDFDYLYGHHRDLLGYRRSLKAFDDYLPLIVNATKPDDLLIITSNHGNDPTFKGYEHTKEYVPVFIYSKKFVDPKQLADIETLADIAATIAEVFDMNAPSTGTSFLNKLS